MDREIRIKKLKKISEGAPYMTGIPIAYRGRQQQFDAFLIPIENLIYNKYNGRIASLVKSFEKQRYLLNAELPKDAKIIENFLWESKADRNKQTLDDLLKNKQLQYGIVTFEGKIIDGNRRAILIRKIHAGRNSTYKKNDTKWSRYFLAVILPDTITEEREISRLETFYQMGEDKKLDYNPIEKYLKCKDLKEEYDFKVHEIAEMMGEDDSKIREWLNILEVMEAYLDYMDYEGIYTRLDKREGQFVDLSKYLARYKDKSKNTNVKWAYKDKDIADLQAISFDYIRAQYEGKEFRSIGQTSTAGSFFHYKDIWDEFLKSHDAHIDPISDNQKSVKEWRRENPETDLTKLLHTRDAEWTSQAQDQLKFNLRVSESRLDNMKEADLPLKLVKKAYDSLKAINTDVDSFYEFAIDEVLGKIINLTNEYRKLIKKK